MPRRKPPPSLVPSSDLTRQDLVDMIGRLRAAVLIDLPELAKDRQTVLKHLLESTNIKNEEPDLHNTEVELAYDCDDATLVITFAEGEDLAIIDFSGADRDDYQTLEKAFMAISAGAKLTCEET